MIGFEFPKMMTKNKIIPWTIRASVGTLGKIEKQIFITMFFQKISQKHQQPIVPSHPYLNFWLTVIKKFVKGIITLTKVMDLIQLEDVQLVFFCLAVNKHIKDKAQNIFYSIA